MAAETRIGMILPCIGSCEALFGMRKLIQAHCIVRDVSMNVGNAAHHRPVPNHERSPHPFIGKGVPFITKAEPAPGMAYRFVGLLLAALAFIASCASAHAETAVNEAAQRMVGAWEISNVDRDRRCSLTFSVEPVSGGFKLELDPACPTAFPLLGDVVAWGYGPKDELRLLNGKGGAVMQFTEVESGLYESERGPEGLLFLQTQAALKIETRTVEQILGEWALLREAEKPLCRLTLSSQAAGSEGYRVTVRAGCDPAIAAFGPTSWRLDRDQLLLAGRGGVWRFSESEATVWERVPLSVDPLLLVRQ
jgi:hypothetical protein